LRVGVERRHTGLAKGVRRMLMIDTELRPSGIHGIGIFLL